MTNDRWIKLNVDHGVVLLNDEVFPLDGTFAHPVTKVVYSLLDTELAGLHMVAYGQNNEYRYAVSLNTGGHYCLGESFGYRVIPDEEEECPIRRALRRNGLPYGMLSHQGQPIQAKVTEGVTVPTAGRYTVVTDVNPSYDLGKSYGIATYAYEDYAYLMEVKTRDKF